MKIVAVVPMKLNNRRLPQKNTKAFTNGRPLCYYILSTLLKITEIEEVYVYCSNPDIKGYIPDGVKYLKRSEMLDQDTTKMNEVLKAFAKDVPADIYVMTHTTAPFISEISIKKGLDAVVSESLIHLLPLKSYRTFCGEMESHLIMIWKIFQELRIFHHCMKKPVVFIFIEKM